VVKIVVKTHNSITNEKAWMKKACDTNGLPPCNSSHPNLRHSAPKPPALPTALHPEIYEIILSSRFPKLPAPLTAGRFIAS